jgi:predicted TIM-barrel fold metal-dependent hydrolase
LRHAPISYTEHDAQIWDEELKEFVPKNVFDAHIHLINPDHVASSSECHWSYADLDTIQRWAHQLYPERETHFLVLGTPVVGIDVGAHNAWSVEQVQRDPQSRINRLVTPACTADAIRSDAAQHGVIGLKPYRIYSVTGDIQQCDITDFLTHEQLEVANELGLWVTMHLSRFHGCADEHNLRDLTEFTTRRYPNVKWILAHCARSFTYWPIREAIERLKDLPNIWYDVSAVTDIRPMITLFKHEQPNRILYGSDGVDATYFRGKYVALGRSWQSLDVSHSQLQFPHCDGRPILAIYEQLLCMKQAAEISGLTSNDVDRIFWKNAEELFGIEFGKSSEPARS